MIRKIFGLVIVASVSGRILLKAGSTFKARSVDDGVPCRLLFQQVWLLVLT
jgi:hypothetical protein